MYLIGDTHGDITKYAALIRRAAERGQSSLHVGDVGLGFPDDFGTKMTTLLKSWDEGLHRQHKMLRGNHDNPETFKTFKMYLGDWGYLPDQDLFFVSGAYSIDQEWRTPGFDWWPEEQLSFKELQEAVTEFGMRKPRFVVTHDCPLVLYPYLVPAGNIHPNNTALALDMMFGLHKPEKWYFGHHHKSKKIVHPDGTVFRCLNEREAFEDRDIPNF